MSILPWLFVFYLLGKRTSGTVFAPAGTPAGKPKPKPQQGPAAFPVTPSPSVVPVSMPSGPTFSPQWKPYHPLNQAVIARAEAILKDASKPAPYETIERDPAGSGNVRYLKVSRPPGHVSVTAWKPSLAAPSSGLVHA